MVNDSQLTELKNLLPTAKDILIAVPQNSDIDKIAAALALYLSLIAQGKQVGVVSPDSTRVFQAHLFAIDKIKNNVSTVNSGNFILTLEGVAVTDQSGGRVPALKNLDYYVEGNNLNLVFNVLPNQSFQPQRIIPHQQTSGFSLIFVIGSSSLQNLGNIYSQNQQVFNTHIVNIDNQGVNSSFGQTNVIAQNVSSVSEIMVSIISALGLSLSGDISTNLLTGIFTATNNLSDLRVNADTYSAIATCLRSGGQKPQQLIEPVVSQPIETQSMHQPISSGLDLSAFIPQSPVSPGSSGSVESFIQPVVTSSENIPSPEERPGGEGLSSDSPEPDWLTPKVFKVPL